MSIKPGDRVRALKTSVGQNFKAGEIYVVSELVETLGYYSGFTLRVEKDSRGEPNGWCLSNFELAYIKEFSNKLESLIDEV